MKYLTLLLSFFTFMSCGNSKEAIATENSQKTMTEISGTYDIDMLNESDYSLSKLTLLFDNESKTVSGFSGCNRFSGTYKMDGNSISFGPLASTRMACGENETKTEQNMLTALSRVTTFSIKGQELTLLNKEVVLIKANSKSEENISQDSNYTLEYTAVTRGFYNHYIYENGKISIQKDRSSTLTFKTCSKAENKQLLKAIEALDLEKLKTLEAPSENRFVDAAASARFKVTYQGNTYETPEFDAGKPNKYIATLLSTFIELAEKQ
ncbi:META domain-containing protein [Bizionia arctica]|uniref:DUF306 domain-containing protein n=1 Tax=Bizionia arctica TaxID=1495645 RepID=A0A917GD18_9FLAO|nr:META domain-containing protein [Bizionia arctica]GGG38635.1 hypothetical protein GCM10010976_07990 [Bizionia arctica]